MFKPNLSTLPKNPLVLLRNERKLNIAQLSRLSDVSSQQIRDAEHGLLQNVPTGVIRVFSTDISEEILDRQYNDWRKLKRSLVGLPPVDSLSISQDVHPLAQYRRQLGWQATTFCEYLCLPRFVVMHYEQKQRIMPRSLRDFALPQAKLPSPDIARLSNMGELYYASQEQRRIRARQAADN